SSKRMRSPYRFVRPSTWIISRQGGHLRPTAVAAARPPLQPPSRGAAASRRRCALRVPRSAVLACGCDESSWRRLRRANADSCELQEIGAGLLEHVAVLGVEEVQAVLVDDLDLHAFPFLPARRADAGQDLLLEAARVAHAPGL